MLGDLIDAGIAELQTGPFGTMLNAKEYTQSGVPVIAVQNIDENNLNWDNLVYVSDKTAERLSKYRVFTGDIIFGRKGAVERRALIRESEHGWIQGSDCIRLRVNKDISSEFLSYQLGSPKIKQWILTNAHGTTMPSLNQEILRRLPLFLPPLPVQKKIAAILSSLDDKIEINTRMNKVLEETARALFHRWFVEFEFPNDEGKPYKSSGGRMIASEMGEIPEGWRVGTLNEITEITMGQSPNGTSYNEQGIGVVFYQGRAEFGFRYPSRRLYTTEPKRMAKKGDVLMSVRAPVGDINLASELCCIGRGLAAIQSTDNHTSFIYYLMLHLQKTLDSFNGEGTVFGSINRSSIESLKVVIPPDSYLELFESIARSLDLFIEKNFMENQRLQLMRDSLLPKLMDCTLAVDPISSKNDIYEID